MKIDPHIRNLLEKHVLNDCSKDEIEQLVNFFKSHEHLSTKDIPSVESVIKLLGEDLSVLDEETSGRIYNDILAIGKKKQEAIKKNKFKKSINKGLRIAAVFTGFIVLGLLYQNKYFFNKSNLDQVHVPENFITLQLSNGEIKVIDTDTDKSQDLVTVGGHVIGKQVKNTMSYSKDAETDQLIYNTLNIPYGKTFELSLSDGTIVHLNAGTSIKYPVKFLKGHSREVFLKGEAYFKVAKDKLHRFIVNDGAVNVEVYGTQFNVSTYPEDEVTDVVLVEGSVSMYKVDGISDHRDEVMLIPGMKGSFDKKQKSIETKPVITSVYTSWINGELVFRDMTFENILKKLERHYDVSITINNEALAKEIFNASFGDEPIRKVLEYLRITYRINYTINDNHITIK